MVTKKATKKEVKKVVKKKDEKLSATEYDDLVVKAKAYDLIIKQATEVRSAKATADEKKVERKDALSTEQELTQALLNLIDNHGQDTPLFEDVDVD